jgi:hypothetical protein
MASPKLWHNPCKEKGSLRAESFSGSPRKLSNYVKLRGERKKDMGRMKKLIALVLLVSVMGLGTPVALADGNAESPTFTADAEAEGNAESPSIITTVMIYLDVII